VTTTTWIIIAVVAVLIVVLLAFVARSATNRRHRVQADRIREDVHHQSERLEKREAIAAETEAKARAAQAEAEVKAAEAARLQDSATWHREHVDSSREELNAQRDRADALDPRSTPAEQPTDDAADDGAARAERSRTVN
jgi:hypothetical protein